MSLPKKVAAARAASEAKATKELGVKKVEGKPGDMKAKQSTEVHY